MPNPLRRIHHPDEARYYIGVDPGMSGSAILLNSIGEPVCRDGAIWHVRFGKATPQEISDWFNNVLETTNGAQLRAAIEFVRSSPQMGVTSAFTFGRGVGLLEGLLAGHRIVTEVVRPTDWQKALNCRTGKIDPNDSGKHKNITKARAHRRWPKLSAQIGHATADSLLIAEYLRLKDQGL